MIADDLRLRAQAAYQSFIQASPLGIAVDTETSGLDFYDWPFCVTLAWYKGDQLESHYIDIRDPEGWNLAGDILDNTPAIVFHNAKFDLQKLILAGLMRADDLPEIHDTETLAHLVDEHQPLGLKKLAAELLGEETDEEQALAAYFRKEKIKKADRDYSELPPQLLIPYAVKDAEFTLRLYRHLWPLMAQHDDLLALYESEMALIVALLRMEAHGMRVDVPYLERIARTYAKRSLDLEIQVRDLSGMEDFNPNSWQQVLLALNNRGIVVEQTDADTLRALDDPLAQLIVELREVRKIHGTYILGLLNEHRDGIVHPNFNPNRTRTGRMSSSGAYA